MLGICVLDRSRSFNSGTARLKLAPAWTRNRKMRHLSAIAATCDVSGDRFS